MGLLDSLFNSLGVQGGANYNASRGTGSQLQSQMSGVSTKNVNPFITPEYLALLGQQQAEYGQLAGQVEPGYQKLFDQAQQNVQGYGAQQRQQLANFYQQQQAQQQQNLMNRGLGNSTIANSVQSGLAQQQAQAGQNLERNISEYGTNVLGQFGMPMLQNQMALGMGAIGAETGVGQQYLGLLGTQGTTLQQNAGYGTGYNQGQQSGYGLQGGIGGQMNPYLGGNPYASVLTGMGGGSPYYGSSGGFLGGGSPVGGYSSLYGA